MTALAVETAPSCCPTCSTPHNPAAGGHGARLMPAQRTDTTAPPAQLVGSLDYDTGKCEAYPSPFKRCGYAALWRIQLDRTDDDGTVQLAWELVEICDRHRAEGLAVVVAALDKSHAGTITITPTTRNGGTA